MANPATAAEVTTLAESASFRFAVREAIVKRSWTIMRDNSAASTAKTLQRALAKDILQPGRADQWMPTFAFHIASYRTIDKDAPTELSILGAVNTALNEIAGINPATDGAVIA